MSDQQVSSKLLTPDICVIGGGSGGLSTAAAAAAFGVSVVLIEGGKMGGDCLNYGCVPSKALIASGDLAHAIRHASKFGLQVEAPQANFGRVCNHVKSVIEAIAPNDSVERFTGLGVQVIEDYAAFRTSDTVEAGGHTIKARRFVIATGSSPTAPPIPGLDTVNYLTNETVFDLSRKPAHLIVIGAGPIGLELAQAYRRLGVEVTVLEAFKALGREDPEAAQIVLDQIREDGVRLIEEAKIQRLEKKGENGARIFLQGEAGEEILEASHIMVATGRQPNLGRLCLDKAGIAFDKKGVRVDKGLRTTNRKVYAIGDVAGGLQFTHVAGYHAGLVIRSILFRLPVKERTDIIPRATYTSPEIAHVGLNEMDMKATDKAFRLLRWPYVENDRAQTDRKTTGFIKVITDKKGKILGATIVGEKASEMISLWALAVSSGQSVKDIVGFVAPYPTLSEIGKRAATTYFTPSLSSPWLQRLLRFLRLFG